MPNPRLRYEVTVPQTLGGVLSLFEGRSPVSHLAVIVVAGLGWVVGYAAVAGGGTFLALVIGSTVCGLVLGIAFTRALGGPALNLVMSIVWPALLGGGVALTGDLALERLYTLSVGVALLFPAFFATFSCMLLWFAFLGPDRIDRWTRRTHRDAFFDEP